MALSITLIKSSPCALQQINKFTDSFFEKVKNNE